jgi:hypothetical protein
MKLKKDDKNDVNVKRTPKEEELFKPEDFENGLKLIESKFEKFKGVVMYEIQKKLTKRNRSKRSLKRSK